MKTKRRRSAAFLLVLVTLLVPGCVFQDEDDDPELLQTAVAIEAFDFYFEPTTIILEAETEATITLTNNGSAAHSFSVPDLDIEIEAEGAEEASSTFVTPSEPGAFEFFCKFHPEDMRGSLSIGTDETFEEEDDTDPTETELEEDADI
ncbi:MAG TPA: cupredoxin domain-containing protein [Actinomycetota bacterium]|nr:cupredoxin domain-containing protein [Actinomycetota bacterium]